MHAGSWVLQAGGCRAAVLHGNGTCGDLVATAASTASGILVTRLYTAGCPASSTVLQGLILVNRRMSLSFHS